MAAMQSTGAEELLRELVRLEGTLFRQQAARKKAEAALTRYCLEPKIMDSPGRALGFGLDPAIIISLGWAAVALIVLTVDEPSGELTLVFLFLLTAVIYVVITGLVRPRRFQIFCGRRREQRLSRQLGQAIRETEDALSVRYEAASVPAEYRALGVTCRVYDQILSEPGTPLSQLPRLYAQWANSPWCSRDATPAELEAMAEISPTLSRELQKFF